MLVLLVSQNERIRNCNDEFEFGGTTLQFECSDQQVRKTSKDGDSDVRQHPVEVEDDSRLPFLELLPTLSSYNNHNCSLASAAHLSRRMDNDFDGTTLKLGPPMSFEEPDVSVGQSKSQFFPVVDEGSTNAGMTCGGYMPALLLASRLESQSGNLQDYHHINLEPSARKEFQYVDNSRSGHHRPKKCRFNGCSKGARGATGLCIGHGGGERCQKPGCHNGAEGRTVFCKSHGGGRRCQHLGCTKSVEGRTDRCIAHGGGRRCLELGCTKAARGNSDLCIRHGGGKRCSVEGCNRSAEGQARLCISHGGGRRCEYQGCKKGAQGSTKHCKSHGGGKRCVFEGCTKGAEGSTLFCKAHGGGKRCLHDGGGVCTKSVHGGTDYCVAHGGGKRCAVAGCTRSARGRTDCCVRHGGGKRCMSHGCGKSAQGSTDFCKSHGGGKRCAWQQGCMKFARGKSGFCTVHGSVIVEQKNMNLVTTRSTGPALGLGSVSITLGSTVDNDCSSLEVNAEPQSAQKWPSLAPRMLLPLCLAPPGPETAVGDKIVGDDGFMAPEERVHGGGLMFLLGGSFHNASIDGGKLV